MQGIKHIGIDFGAKNAGTTAICYALDNQLEIELSEKKKNADKFLYDNLLKLHPEKVFIDAPLSLPLAYYNKASDFFYRKVDRELQGMSPMFLGGLTARSMQLKTSYPEIAFYETYPKYLVTTLGLKTFYKNDQNAFISELKHHIPLQMPERKMNWHEIDSVLAWLSGWRFLHHKANVYGNEIEGLAYI